MVSIGSGIWALIVNLLPETNSKYISSFGDTGIEISDGMADTFVYFLTLSEQYLIIIGYYKVITFTKLYGKVVVIRLWRPKDWKINSNKCYSIILGILLSSCTYSCTSHVFLPKFVVFPCIREPLKTVNNNSPNTITEVDRRQRWKNTTHFIVHIYIYNTRSGGGKLRRQT